MPAGVREYFLKGVWQSGGRVSSGAVRSGPHSLHRRAPRHRRRSKPSGGGAFRRGAPFRSTGNDADDAVEPPDTLLEHKTAPAATYGSLPAAALDPKRYVEWSRDFADWIVQSQPLKLFSAPALKLLSEPGESERDFRIRTQQTTRELRDGAVETLRARFAPKVARLTEKRRKAQEVVEREQQQVGQQKLQTAVSLGATMLGALMGRRAVSLSTLGRATTAARGVGRSMKEAQDVERAQVKLQEVEAEVARAQRGSRTRDRRARGHGQ